MSVRVDTFGTAANLTDGRQLSDEKISEAIKKVFDLRPGIIIKELNLRQPIYRQIAAYGHFGRPELDLPWERTDRVEELKKIVEQQK